MKIKCSLCGEEFERNELIKHKDGGTIICYDCAVKFCGHKQA